MSFFSLPSAVDEVKECEPALKKTKTTLVEYQSSSDEGEEFAQEEEVGAKAQWASVWSEVHGAYYYCHHTTGETVWELPDGEWAEEPEAWDDLSASHDL